MILLDSSSLYHNDGIRGRIQFIFYLSNKILVTFIPLGTIHAKFVVKLVPLTLELFPDATQVVNIFHSYKLPKISQLMYN